MHTFKSFEKNLSIVNDNNFENIALRLFKWQALENQVYQKYLTYLGVNPKQVKTIRDIPFLPISFFKEHEVVTGSWKAETFFKSSTTTGMVPSIHKVKSLEFYLQNAIETFQDFYGPLTDYHFFALLPSYLERDGSSLVAMVNRFITETQSPYSGFYLNDRKELLLQIEQAKKTTKKVILLGVSFALLDLAEEGETDLSSCLVMETGGMKGRRQEITREELHHFLSARFNVSDVHSEYGMTELFSQAYAKSQGYFKTPAGMKVLVRGVDDPFEYLGFGQTGGVNVIDLSNIYTCAFVETQDLGRIRQDGSFEVLGRMDNSDARGCNLLVG